MIRRVAITYLLMSSFGVVFSGQIEVVTFSRSNGASEVVIQGDKVTKIEEVLDLQITKVSRFGYTIPTATLKPIEKASDIKLAKFVQDDEEEFTLVKFGIVYHAPIKLEIPCRLTKRNPATTINRTLDDIVKIEVTKGAVDVLDYSIIKALNGKYFVQVYTESMFAASVKITWKSGLPEVFNYERCERFMLCGFDTPK